MNFIELISINRGPTRSRDANAACGAGAGTVRRGRLRPPLRTCRHGTAGEHRFALAHHGPAAAVGGLAAALLPEAGAGEWGGPRRTVCSPASLGSCSRRWRSERRRSGCARRAPHSPLPLVRCPPCPHLPNPHISLPPFRANPLPPTPPVSLQPPAPAALPAPAPCPLRPPPPSFRIRLARPGPCSGPTGRRAGSRPGQAWGAGASCCA